MKQQPWLKWYPADWRAHTKLKMCSLSARGLWVEMIGMMHEAEPYGHLLIDGVKPSTSDLAAIIGRPIKEVTAAYAELQHRGVFSLSDSGVPYSRKMVRDKAKADQDRMNGKAGGNPKLSDPVNRGVNPPDKAQIPEARDQKEEPPTTSLSAPQRGRDDGSKRGTRLAADWQPSDADRQFAHEQGLDADAVAERFRDFWIAKPGRDGCKLDWPATWRNWCRNDSNSAHRGLGGQRTDGKGPASLAASARAVLAQGEAEPGVRPTGLRPGEAA